jgi:hypothetical protein
MDTLCQDNLWQLGMMNRIVKFNVLAVICLNSGEQFKFSLALDYKYGKGTAEELLHKSRQINKMSSKDFEGKISYYKLIVEKLLKDKGLK